jgi:hypothetical protein
MIYEENKWAVVDLDDDSIVEVFDDEEAADAWVQASADCEMFGYRAVLATIRWPG